MNPGTTATKARQRRYRACLVICVFGLVLGLFVARRELGISPTGSGSEAGGGVPSPPGFDSILSRHLPDWGRRTIKKSEDGDFESGTSLIDSPPTIKARRDHRLRADSCVSETDLSEEDFFRQPIWTSIQKDATSAGEPRNHQREEKTSLRKVLSQLMRWNRLRTMCIIGYEESSPISEDIQQALRSSTKSDACIKLVIYPSAPNSATAAGNSLPMFRNPQHRSSTKVEIDPGGRQEERSITKRVFYVHSGSETTPPKERVPPSSDLCHAASARAC
jgi:hypothetical protein